MEILLKLPAESLFKYFISPRLHENPVKHDWVRFTKAQIAWKETVGNNN